MEQYGEPTAVSEFHSSGGFMSIMLAEFDSNRIKIIVLAGTISATTMNCTRSQWTIVVSAPNDVQ